MTEDRKYQKLFKYVDPGQWFTFQGLKLRRIGNSQWASDAIGDPWIMMPGDYVEVEPVAEDNPRGADMRQINTYERDGKEDDSWVAWIYRKKFQENIPK